MHALLPLALVVFSVAALVAVFAWRKRQGAAGSTATVAKTNHKSVRTFQYAPPPALAPAAAAPELPVTSILTQLLPEEEFKAQQEREIQQEADQQEAAEALARQSAATPQTAANVAPAPAAPAPTTKIEATAPVVAPEAAPVVAPAPLSVLDRLAVANPAATPAPVAAEPVDETVPPALLDNPVTAPAPTANDKENRRVGNDLRQRQRAALQANSAQQKAAMSAIYGANAPA